MIELSLPYPPSVNSYWRHVVIGQSARVLISRTGREYRTQVKRLCLAHRWGGGFPVERLAVAISLHAQDNRRRDLDNANKALLDALGAAGVYGDDSQIDALVVVRGPNRRPGCAVVRIEALPDKRPALGLPNPLKALEAVPF